MSPKQITFSDSFLFYKMEAKIILEVLHLNERYHVTNVLSTMLGKSYEHDNSIPFIFKIL